MIQHEFGGIDERPENVLGGGGAGCAGWGESVEGSLQFVLGGIAAIGGEIELFDDLFVARF